MNALRTAARDERGNVLLLAALLLPIVLGAVGLAVDFQTRIAQKEQLQQAADSLALRGAKDLMMQGATEAKIESMLDAIASNHFKAKLGPFDFAPAADLPLRQVTVEIGQPSKELFFLSQLIPHEDPIVVRAVAEAKGTTNICVIALEEDAAEAIEATKEARLEASQCAILSNSTSSAGISVSGQAKLTAHMICSAGGADGASMAFSPSPVYDCPVYDDPLANRMPPSIGACDHSNFSDNGASTVSSGETVASIDGSTPETLAGYDRLDLSPGVYCGGVKLNGKVDAHLAPGVYVIKDGPLDVMGGARLFGEDVGFYFEGDKAVFTFKGDSIVNLKAPSTGLMAGMLFWESADSPDDQTHEILSENARELLGTIYLPKGVFRVDTKTNVADTSAYTAIIAKSLKLDGSPRLVLNADYASTTVPAPDGVGPIGGGAILRD